MDNSPTTALNQHEKLKLEKESLAMQWESNTIFSNLRRYFHTCRMFKWVVGKQLFKVPE